MKLSKKKVFTLALSVCMLAILSLGSLAWFTDSDSAKNDFYFADSETVDPDDIFSVEVWEDDDSEDPEGDDKHDNLGFTSILPGDDLYKEVHIENTGHHDQYIRATVTVSGAKVWQELYGVHVVPLGDLVTGLTEDPIHTEISYYDAENDAFVYELYFDKAVAATQEIILFETVSINEALTQQQAAALNGNFTIDVVAHAVQTRNVGDNVLEAFQTIGEVKTIMVSDADELKAALQDETIARVVVNADNMAVTINYPVNDKVLDFNGKNSSVRFIEKAQTTNLIVCGIRDTDGAQASVSSTNSFAGSVKLLDCVVKSGENAAMKLGSGNITIDGCNFLGVENAAASRGIHTENAYNGDLNVSDCTFEELTKAAIEIRMVNGNVSVTGCAFENVAVVWSNPAKQWNASAATISFTDCTVDGNAYSVN